MGSFRSHLHLGRSVISIISVARFPSEITSKPITLRSFSSGSAFQCENGVSMVQGGSRGIGLEFVRQLLNNYVKGHVIATCRNPNGAESLLDLKKQHTERLTLLQLDVTDESSIDVAAKTIRDTHGRLDLLINTSGILSIPNVLKPETTLSKVEKASLLLSFEVNAVGPLLVIKHMWPLLKAGGGQGSGRETAIVANLSARVGSIGDNRLGGWHSYRASKTALNQCNKEETLSKLISKLQVALVDCEAIETRVTCDLEQMGCQVLDESDNLIAVESVNSKYTIRINDDEDFEDFGLHTTNKFVLDKSSTKHLLDSLTTNSKVVQSVYGDAVRIDAISKTMKIGDLPTVRDVIVKFKALQNNL